MLATWATAPSGAHEQLRPRNRKEAIDLQVVGISFHRPLLHNATRTAMMFLPRFATPPRGRRAPFVTAGRHPLQRRPRSPPADPMALRRPFVDRVVDLRRRVLHLVSDRTPKNIHFDGHVGRRDLLY